MGLFHAPQMIVRGLTVAGMMLTASSGCSDAAQAEQPPSPTAAASATPAAPTPTAPTPTPADVSSPVAEDPSPCPTAPDGMVCIPGGTADVGSDKGPASERPQHTVALETYFIDRHAVTNAEYQACEKAGRCRRRRRGPQVRKLQGDDAPATPVSWRMAHDYCLWAGKRLPTEAEWEWAAKVTEEGFADREQWVADWAAPCFDGCRRPCGEGCTIDNPHGPCNGAPRCKGFAKRVLKGGTDEDGTVRLTARKARAPNRAMTTTFRCASTTPLLTHSPPLVLSEERPELGEPEPPTAQQLALFRSIPDDEDILKIVPCKREGNANLDCRDPMSYIKTNERAQYLWEPYIENLGGAYVGLGSDQSYHLIAAARSRWAWIFDYDPTVVRLHYVIRTVILANETPAGFVDAFRPKNRRTTRELIAATLEPEAERGAADEVFRKVRPSVLSHYINSAARRRHGFGWLRDADAYHYVRTMLQQGRIAIIKGNMLNDVALPAIGRVARELGVPIRIYYPSNASAQWKLPEQYRQNVMGFPFDERSVVLSTMWGGRWNEGGSEESYWHYLVQGGLHLQEAFRRRHVDNVDDFMAERVPTDVSYLTTVRLPGAPAPVGRAEAP